MSEVPDKKPASPEAPSGIHMAKPLDEMSVASVAVVADAAAIIAAKKLEAANQKMAAAQAAMERLAALKAGKPLPPKPTEETPVVVAAAVATSLPETSEPVIEPEALAAASVVEAPEPVGAPDVVPEAPKAVEAPKPTVFPKPLTEVKVIPINTRPAPASVPMPEAPVQQHSSGIMRLAGALRAEAAARAPKIKAPTGKRSLDPVANHSGLSQPRKHERKIVTPGLIFLLALMTFYALYASGNLPQFDRWTDSVVNDAHAHNDQIVGGILGAGRIILIGGALLIVVLAGFLLKNYLNQKHNADHERDFNTR